MKKALLIILAFVLIAAAVVGWIFLGPVTGFADKKETLYIRSDAATKGAVLDSLVNNKIINRKSTFSWLAGTMGYWQNIKPGKYEIDKGSSLLTIVRRLRNGLQTPVNFTITKLRTKEDLARFAGRKFEFDSAQMMAYLNNRDSLSKWNTEPEQAMTLVMPDTYTFFWNTTPQKVFQKLAEESKKFWTEERKEKAAALGIDPKQAYILASIVEEETNNLGEKDTIASVYLNRVKRGMPLGADPTIKFALKDFALTRIYGAHLKVESPYNTYRNKGLPPGPICTPSAKTIDAVLAAPSTNYLFFVAHQKLNGTHQFSTTYSEHMQKARAYQQAYKVWDSTRKAKNVIQ